MKRNKNKQYQLKVQKFNELAEQYKQMKGVRQETIDKFTWYSNTLEKLRKDDFNLHPNFVFQYAYDVASHYCAIVEHTIYILEKG